MEISKRKSKKIHGATKALILSTIAMVVSFMSWSSLSPLANDISQRLGLNLELQKAMIALPVLLGSILRVPFGKLSDKYGGRKIYLISLCASLIPIFLTYLVLQFNLSKFLIFVAAIGLGISGASFAVSLSYASVWYHKKQQGSVLGIVGVGTIGNAISASLLPSLSRLFHSLSSVYLFLVILTLIFIIIFGLFAEESTQPPQKNLSSIHSNKNLSALILLSFACLIASGSFVSFGNLLPTFLGNQSIFNLSPLIAGLWSAAFSILTIITRPIGGYLSDHFNPKLHLFISLLGICICQFLLSIFNHFLMLFLLFFMIFAIFIGLCNGYIFKMTAEIFENNIGFSTGIVGAVGSFGGFIFPFVFILIPSISTSFIILSFVSLASAVSFIIYFYKLQ